MKNLLIEYFKIYYLFFNYKYLNQFTASQPISRGYNPRGRPFSDIVSYICNLVELGPLQTRLPCDI